MPPTVTPARTETERSAVLGVLMLAFAADPFLRWMLRRPEAFVSAFPVFAGAFLDAAWAVECASVVARGGVVQAASIWMPPGVAPDPDAVFAGLRDALSEGEIAAALPNLVEIGGFHPQEPHWYLAVIGVDPRCQGEGCGSALLRQTLARVDADGLPAYLESSNAANLPLYQRFGFEVMGEIVADEHARIWPMFRSRR